MTTRDEPPSLSLGVAANKLRDKGHYARGAEKFATASAAAAQELAAEDCLIVTRLRAAQANCLAAHSRVRTLPAAESGEAIQTARVLLTPCISTLTRRKEAGTLLPGSCRPAEVAWFRAYHCRGLLSVNWPADNAHAGALAEVVGTDTYCLAAGISIDMLLLSNKDELSYVAFLASALDLLASQPREPVDIMRVRALNQELTLATNVNKVIHDEWFMARFDHVTAALLTDAWLRVERSGVLDWRLAGNASGPVDPTKSLKARLAAVDAEAAVRGLHTCALADCTAREVHVSQFKKCGACMKIAYCCREHQVEDWPAHKAACKAARKAAAPKDNT